MDRTENMMFSLLRSLFSGAKTQITLTPEDMRSLYKLSKRHEVAHLMAEALARQNLLEGSPMASQFEAQLLDAHYRAERYTHAFEEVSRVLEAARIPFIPLKGLVIRPLYPESWMRTSCDMDILVHESDLQRAAELLTQQLGYRNEGLSAHDLTLSSADGVRIELHYTLVEENRAVEASKVLASVWNHAHPAHPGGAMHRMDGDMLFCYHIAHMTKHFESGGCGIRFLLDLWLLEQQGFYTEHAARLLKQVGLTTFAAASMSLSNLWFGNGQPDELLLHMQAYILSSGIYGSSEHQYAIRRYRFGGNGRYLLHRIFLPFRELTYQYPVLLKHRWMYPFCQAARWLALLWGSKVRRRKEVLRELHHVSEEQVAAISRLLTQLEL